MAGQQYETFNDLLKHVEDLVGDRTVAAMMTKPTNGVRTAAEGRQGQEHGKGQGPAQQGRRERAK
eukprot:9130818-Heterocapsa_arctica.AAC.1